MFCNYFLLFFPILYLANGSAFDGGGGDGSSTSISPKKASLASRFFIAFNEQLDARLVLEAARLSLELARDMLDKLPRDLAKLVLEGPVLSEEGREALFKFVLEMDKFLDMLDLSVEGDFGEALGDPLDVNENLLPDGDCSCTDIDLTIALTFPSSTAAVPTLTGFAGTLNLGGVGVAFI